jgi:transposase
MIGMVDKEIIRRMHTVHGWSERRIAREVGFARMTVRKYVQEEYVAAPRYRRTRPRATPVLDHVLPLIQQWLVDSEQQPRKQRRTAHRIWQQLRDEYAVQGGASTIRAAVRHLKRPQRPVFVPLAFAPGERAEVDGGTAKVLLAGQITEVHLFCARLRFSGMPFVSAFPCQPQEAFFTGHRQAVDFWGGVPRMIVYDNLTTAVRRVLMGHQRHEQAAFISRRMH